MRISTVATLFALLSGCSAMLLGEGQSSAPAIGSNDRSAQQLGVDEALESAVRSVFSSDNALRSAEVKVEARDAVITLSGTLGSFELRDHAVGITEGVSGVDRVNNQLQVNTRQ